jgi:hypothetical protein
VILLCCAASYSNSVLPTGFIAAKLGHADTRMTEKYYAHLAPSSSASLGDLLRVYIGRSYPISERQN